MRNKSFHFQKGFVAILFSVVILAIVLIIALSVSFLAWREARMAKNILESQQSYYAAEAGAEDALLRLSNDMNWQSPYSLNTGNAISNISISNIVGGARTITSEGNASSRIRKIAVVYGIKSDNVSFHYGAQVGEGGITMGSGSRVEGNIFSNGNITGSGTIVNDVIVAGNGHKIQGIDVGGNATVHTCDNADIAGTLYYVSGGSIMNCTYQNAVDRGPNEITSVALPISQSQIDAWKAEAASNINLNNVTVSGTQSLGPLQVGTPGQPRNLTISNNATLKVAGTIFVTGNIITGNNSTIELDAAYGALSGVVLASGLVTVANNSILRGTGQPGSYILILSTSASDSAITVENNALGAIFYTSAGGIMLSNNMKAREITGYKITLGNNAVIEYDSGLQDASFSSGPGGSWEVVSWREIE